MSLFGRSSYGSGNRGGGLRWIIAIVIAAIGIIGYMNKKQINPVTGEAQHVDLTVDQEKALGLQAAPQMAAELGGAADPARDPAARMVNEVGLKVIKSTEAFKSPYR